jgi:hypothetical protein
VTDDPHFQAQIDDLKSEQREQGIEQDAQAGVQERQGLEQVAQAKQQRAQILDIDALDSSQLLTYVLVAVISAILGFLGGIAFAEYGHLTGLWGYGCFWGVPC